jgi:hypothetical protein
VQLVMHLNQFYKNKKFHFSRAIERHSRILSCNSVQERLKQRSL